MYILTKSDPIPNLTYRDHRIRIRIRISFSETFESVSESESYFLISSNPNPNPNLNFHREEGSKEGRILKVALKSLKIAYVVV